MVALTVEPWIPLFLVAAAVLGAIFLSRKPVK
jgi:hypothetical protein